MKRLWTWLTDDHVIGTEPDIARYFLRCQNCGRVFRHYWSCVTAADVKAGAQVGCSCGAIKHVITVLPNWQAALLLAWCFVTRRLIQKKTYWDPRMPARVRPIDV